MSAPVMRVSADQGEHDLLKRAAHGDGEAQLALVDHAYAQFEKGYVSLSHAVRVAEVWARLAAAHDTPAAWWRLARVLFDLTDIANVEGNYSQARFYAAEGLKILDRLADAGDESAAAKMAWVGETLGIKIMREVVEVTRAVSWDDGEKI